MRKKVKIKLGSNEIELKRPSKRTLDKNHKKTKRFLDKLNQRIIDDWRELRSKLNEPFDSGLIGKDLDEEGYDTHKTIQSVSEEVHDERKKERN
ncbi:MAG: hypothetical protein PHE43_03750 [Candidatus Nanoarchaeia archaeon]|nr:hypothetical protein [Candidatus Nanoarchaeia archaeon]